MKFTCENKAFAHALGYASRIVEKRNTIPILSNVLIEASGSGDVRIKATDLDVEFSMGFKADVEVTGAITVSAALLNDIVRKLSNEKPVAFELSADQNTAKVSSGRSKFNLQCLPSSDFPDMNSAALTHSFTISSTDLNKIMKKTQFAISTEETRYYLNGIFLHTTENQVGNLVLRGVATDGHRLAYTSIDAPSGSESMPGIIIPRKTVGLIEKLSELGKEMAISLSHSKISIVVGDTVLISKLIDGTFPDYMRVVPKNGNQIAVCEKKQLAIVVDRVSTISSERGRACRLDFDDTLLKVAVNNPESGSAEDDMNIIYDGSPLSIGFNAKYLNDILINVDGNEVRIALTDSGAPAVFTLDSDADTLFVLMPMRI